MADYFDSREEPMFKVDDYVTIKDAAQLIIEDDYPDVGWDDNMEQFNEWSGRISGYWPSRDRNGKLMYWLYDVHFYDDSDWGEVDEVWCYPAYAFYEYDARRREIDKPVYPRKRRRNRTNESIVRFSDF